MVKQKDIYWLLKLSRPQNLLITALSFILAAWFSHLKSLVFFENHIFWLELTVILMLTASGYWINDVFDYKIDLINKPHKTFVNIEISTKKVWSFYFACQITALIMSIFLPFKFFIINSIAGISLFLYARYFKRMSVIGNLVVSFLTALVIISGSLLQNIKIPLMWLSIFAFIVTMIREIAKDAEDIKGDVQQKLWTLPIQIGLRNTKYILAYLLVFFSISIFLPIFFEYLLFQKINFPYLICIFLTCFCPALYGVILLKKIRFPSHYHQLSSLLKLMMLGGMLACLFL